jgi:subtilisin family serine protease
MKKVVTLICFIVGGLLTNFTILQAQNAEHWQGKLFLKLKDNAYVNLPDYYCEKHSQPDKYPVLGPLFQTFEVQEVMRPFPLLKSTTFENTYQISFNPENNLDEFIRLLQNNPAVEYAEKVPIDRICYDPNDPKEGDGSQWSLSTIQAQAAWDINLGSSAVTVAIVDDAVLTTHEDIAASLWVNSNEIAGNNMDDDGDGYIDNMSGWDCADNDNNPMPPTTASSSSFGHGTHCAGIAGATTNNGIGVASIGNGIRIMPVKCTSNSSADPSIITAGWQGVQYAIAAGADIISISWGSSVYSTTYQNLVNYAESQGVAMVAAAGNAGSSSPFYPAGYDICVGVAATTSTNAKASYSNYGAWVDIAAPGSSIYGIVPAGTAINTYVNKSGTSMATPLTAGLLGLMLSNNTSLTPAQLRSCLYSGASNIDAQNSSYIGMLGAGRINALAAMTCIAALTNATSSNCNTPGSIAASNVTSSTANLSWTAVSGTLSYSVRYRVQGTTTWGTEISASSNSLSLSDLVANTTYEVQTRAICSTSSTSAFSSSSSFITSASTCNTPTNLTVNNTTSNSTNVAWASVSGASSYTLRFRTSGGTWGSDINVTTNTGALSGLTASTSYEIQVKAVCSATNSSAYTSSTTFTTAAPTCNIPSNLASSNITQNSATLSWAAATSASSYTVRYRIVGGTWGADINTSNTSTALSGLTATTNYEFQVKTVCNANSSSAFSASGTFSTTAATTCATPNNLASSNITASGATLSWTAASGASSYVLNYRVVGASTWSSDISTATNSYSLSNLTAATNYQFQVKTVCSTSSSSAYATAVAFTTTAAPCNTPTNLASSNITASGATLSWTAASGASSYVLNYRVVGASTWSSDISTATNSYSLSSLTAATNYQFQVKTVCSTSSSSAYATAVAFTTTAAPCNTPTNLASSNITASGATLSWTAASGASSYVLNYRVVGASTWSSDISTATNSYSLTALTAATNYQFQVKTVCSTSSSSAYATAVAFTTSAAPCNTPTNLASSNITASGATLSWTAASGASSYVLNYRVVGASTWSSDISTATNSYSLSSLTAATNYQFQVKTVCSTSSSSAYATAVTFATTAAATSCGIPTALTATNLTATGVTMTWNAVSGATSYTLRYRLSGATTWTTTSTTTNSKTLSALSTNSLYEAQVKAICGTVNGSYTASTTFTPTAATVCNTPTNLASSNVSASGATLSWAAASGASSYVLNYRVVGASTWSSDISTATNSYSLTALTAATNYEFQVKTVCSTSNSSTYATAVAFTTSAATVCATPTNLASSNITASGATLSWTAASGASSYVLNYRVVGASTWSSDISTATNSYSLTALTASTNYQFQVKTVCSTSSSSAYATAVTFATTAAATSCGIPTALTATNLTATGVTMTWNAISGATSYTLRYRLSGATTWTTTSTTTNSKTLSALSTNSLYEAQVKAICGTVNGSYTASTTFTPTAATVCTTPTNLASSNITASGATLSWTAASGASSYVLNYRVVGASAWSSDISTATNSQSLTGLTAATNYEFQVKTVCSTSSSSAYATAVTFTTTTAPTSCGIPTALTATNLTATGVTMTWNAVSGATSYTLRYRLSGATTWTTTSTTTNSKTLSGLTTGAVYETQAKAICGTVNGSYSSTVMVTMPSSTQSVDENENGNNNGVGDLFDNNSSPQCPNMDISFDYIVSDKEVIFDYKTQGSFKSFFWNFGDGEFAEIANAKHRYSEAGNYLFEVTVEDYSGCKEVFRGFVYITEDDSTGDLNTD